jgi:hypothetical protein
MCHFDWMLAVSLIKEEMKHASEWPGYDRKLHNCIRLRG